ncbi:PEP-CTERM sorting domain-containing protein [Massilia pseudoviolaceinigra]|uniref:PEP-CTERM sorting domain-containing protein n=1 Tax=Massilia pseudoviolaceinigra TaxID=3057165 RepID=UPI002796D67D|nr:PEP-CTERM sorting domain-containing protein [Massilia sp. CCM 9206]MDQ1923939.1 PEP-CTERM sorting domain-containing protein [Massilia sp. CCM 9206]
MRPPLFAAAVLATLFAGAPAHAAAPVHIDATGLTFDTAASGRAETLISDINGVAIFALPNAADQLPLDQPSYGFFHNTYSGLFQLNTRPGYKITGYSLSGEFGGTLSVPAVPEGLNGTVGVAATRAALSLGARLPDASGMPTSSHALADLNGTNGFTLSSGPLDHTGALALQLDGYTYGFSKPSTWTEGPWHSTAPSTAHLWLKDSLRLTVYTTAVPEPHSYALMLAGLALVGGLARRRNKA